MSFTPELRFYCFTNFYLSSIQHGVQTGHCAVDLVTKYLALRGDPNTPAAHVDMVTEWATKHKTFIILNGGELTNMSGPLLQAVKNSNFPWETFNEDAGLGNILTAVGVVIPEYIFDVEPWDESYYPDNSGIRVMTGKKGWRYRKPENVGGVEIVYSERNAPNAFNLINAIKGTGLAR